MSFKPPALM